MQELKMSLWNELGYTDNPYSPRPIEANELGVQLLVGREKELKKLQTYLQSSDTHTTLEGPNGVGKTSLVAVAGFLLCSSFRKRESQQALIPIAEPFQLSATDTATTFKRKVFLRVAQAFIENYELLKERGYNVPNVDDVNQWLNSPVLTTRGIGGGMTLGGTGGSLSGSTGTFVNAGAGFSEEGFVAKVSMWLRECFQTNNSGGFICSIDNLELLETSKNARFLIEAIRDEVLGVKGLKWVLCGARGIVRSVASSPRLQGVLADPIPVKPIADEYIQQLMATRLKLFAMSDKATAPVDAIGFEHLYNIGNKNLRNALKYSEDFAFWAKDNSKIPENPNERFMLLETWMAEMASQYEEDTTGLGKRAWEVFDKLVAAGGSAAPSDYEQYDFESPQAMNPHLRDLELANLIESEIDESDKRRRTINISSRGWIVNYKRSGFSQTTGEKQLGLK